MAKNQEVTRQQNKIYYEMKARELLEKRDQDDVGFALAKILLKNLNMKIEDFLPSPATLKQNRNVTTAATSGIRNRTNHKPE